MHWDDTSPYRYVLTVEDGQVEHEVVEASWGFEVREIGRTDDSNQDSA